jgi:hypothetical protein
MMEMASLEFASLSNQRLQAFSTTPMRSRNSDDL